MSKDSSEHPSSRSSSWLTHQGIPGVAELAGHITEANNSGVLFFLAVEMELLVQQYIKKNGLPPTPVDLEMMLAEAAKAMIGE